MKKFDTFRTVLFTLLLLVGLTTVGWGQTPVTVFSENFDGFSEFGTGSSAGGGAHSTDVTASGSLDTYTQQPGWIGSKVYQAGGKIKMGGSSALGWIQTPSVNLAGNGGAFTLRFRAMAWSADTTTIKVKVITATDTVEYLVSGLSNTSAYTLSQFELPLTGGTSNTMIQFAGKQAAKGRFFLEDLEILQTIPSLAIVTPAEGQAFLTTESFIGNMIIQNFNPGVDGFLKIDAAFLYPIIGSTTMYCGPAELAMLSSFPFQLPAGNYSITATLVGMDSVAIIPAVTVTRNFSFIAPPPALAIVSPTEGQIFATTDTLRANLTFENFVPGVDGLLKLEAAFLYPIVGSTTMYCGPAELGMLSMFPIQLPAGNYSIIATLVGMDSVAITPAVSVTRNFSFINVYDPTILPESGFYYYAQTVSMNCETPGAEIRYTLDGSTPTDTSLLYTAPFTVSQNTTVNAIAFTSDSTYSNMVTATYTFPVEVANIRDFKAANATPTTTVYKITGDVTFVFRDDRNIFVQDTTGGLLVFDFSTPVVTRQYVEGDVITGGICGTYSLFNGLSEMIPAADFPASTVNSGAVMPIVGTITDFVDNYATYETRLVKLTGTTFNTPGYTFTGNGNTNITQGVSQMVFRNHFGNLTNIFTTPAEKQSITGFLITYNATRQLAPRATTDIVPDPAELPFNVDFETATSNANWTLVNGTVSNKWYIGQAQGFDNNKLFISSSNGITNKYNANENLINVVHAYRDIQVSELGGLLSFDYRVMGEICSPQCDYLQVSLLPVNTQLVAGTIPSSYLVQLNGTNDWSTYSSVLPAGTYRLVFTWVNDQYSGEQYPAAVDNIVINPATCATPSNLAATIDATLGVVSAHVSWTISGTQNAWLLQYKLTNHTEWYSVNVTGSPLATLTNLQPNSTYDYRVKALCEGENSQYAVSTFVTPCVNSIISSLPYRVGTGSSLIGTIPSNTYIKYSYSQEIFLASELTASGIPAAPATINTIAYRYNYSTAQPRNIDIYMVNTTNSTFASTASTSWMPVTSGNLVYSGTVNFSGTGTDNWVIINLTTPFQYTGNNIMIAMDDNTGTAGASASKFYYHSSSGSYVTMYYYNSTNNPNPISMTYAANSRTSNINDIRFYANTVVCVDTIVCPLPRNLAVNNITAYTADISWTAGSDETSWGVEYKLADATDWTVINSSSSSITLTGLQRISNYVVRLKAICGNNDNSLYTSPVAFTTLATCPTPANFTYNNAANMTTITWDAAGQTEWISQIKQASQDDNAWTTINIYNLPTATISGLVPNTLYNFRVKAICSEEDQSAWGIFNFTSGCLPFSIPFEEKFASTSLPSCWTNVNNAWTFSSGTARSTSLTPNNFIITPAISLPASGNIAIHYDIATSIAADEHYDVMISFRGTNPDNFISLYDETINNTTLTNRVVSIPAEYNGGNVYIAFVHNSAASSATLILDNVVVSACASAPTQLTASNITSSSVDLSWTVDASATQWILEYSLNQSVWNTMNVSTNPYTLTGLTAYTTYYVRVKTICSDGFESIYSNVLNITTLCPLYNIPFTENFDTYSSGVNYFPDCWKRITNNSTQYPYIYNGKYSSSPNALYFYSTSTYYSYAVTPELNITNANDLLVKFKALKTSAAYGILDIGVMTNPNDISTFVSLGSISSANYTTTNTWYDFEISLVSYVGTGKYIALRAPVTSSTNYVYVDNLEITHLPSCPKPMNLTLSAFNDNSASFTWTPGRSETSWTFEYKLSTVDTWTTVNNVTTNSYTITGLAAATNYTFDVRVKALCTAEGSDWNNRQFTFKTPCGAFTSFPYIQGFDETTFPPECWTVAHTAGTSTNTWIRSTSTIHTGAGSAQLQDQQLGNKNNLVTPQFNIPTANTHQVTFWIYRSSYSSLKPNEGVKVWTNSTPDTIGGTPLIYIRRDYLAQPVVPAIGWYEYSAVIPNGGIQYIIFEGISEYGTATFIDDIKVDRIPTCFKPTAFTASNITTNSATISWTPGGTESQWTLEYKLTSSSTWTTVANLTTNSYTISGLTPSTRYSYDVRVKAICSLTDESEWGTGTLTFSTLCLNITALPYSESFDSYGTGTTAFPSCWTKTLANGSNPYITTTNNTPPGSLYFVSNLVTIASSPEFAANINTLRVTFNLRREGSSSGTFTIGVLTDPNDASTFVAVQTLNPTVYTFQPYVIDLSSYSGTGHYIGFKQEATSSAWYYWLDDVVVDVIPTCLNPTALTASNITLNSANISWVAGGAESQWTLEYKLASESTWTTVTNITTNSYSLSNLLTASTYNVRVKSVCSISDESSWSNTYTFITACDVHTNFPFIESFDGSVFPPLCWTVAHTVVAGGSATYTWIRGTSYVHTGAGSAQLQDQQLGNKNNLVTPQFNIPTANTHKVTFWVYRSSYSSSMVQEGVKVWANSTPDTVGGTPLTYIRREYTSQPAVPAVGWYEYSAFIPNAGLQYIIFEGISEYGNPTYIDDITINIIPTCFKPTALSASNISATSADISWTAGATETNWELSYKLSTDLSWTSINLSTASYSLSGLSVGASYDVKVRSICSETDASDWSSIITFETLPCMGGNSYIIGTQTTPYEYLPFYGYYGYTYSQQIYDASELNNQAGLISAISFYCTTVPTGNNGAIQLWLANTSKSTFSSNIDYINISKLTPVYNMGNSLWNLHLGWNTLTLSTPFLYDGTSNLAVALYEGYPSYASSAFSANATTEHKSISHYSDTQEYVSYTDPANASGTQKYELYRSDIKFVVCPPPQYELKMVSVDPIYDACDLTNIPITMTVKNNGVDPIYNFIAHYQVNANSVVSDTINLVTPIPSGSTFEYTFSTLANFIDPSNVLTVWFDFDNDYDLTNNSLTLTGIDLVSPIAVPYNENFTNVVLDQNGWRVYDVNDDEVIWTKTNGKLQYAYNDALAANDWVMTPCINIPAGKYEIAYSYNALSVMPESFSSYMGLGPSIADMTTLLASHPSVVKTASDIIFRDTITLTTDGIYYFGFNATSLPGNLGLTVDNFSITPMIDLNVTYGPNGMINPNGLVTVPLNSTATFGISPNTGFHIKGIFVDDVLVRGEDMQNSRFEFFNYGPVQQAANIHVTFEVSQYNIIASASNYMNIDYFGDGTIAGTIAPMDTTVVEFGYTQDYIMTPAEHYHLYSFLVDGRESIGNVTDLGNGTFKYNTGRVYAPHNLEAIFKLDTVAIIYNIYSGQGTADGMYADATVTSPVVRYTYVDYNSDHLSTILPAPGYRTESVAVNGTPLAGIVDYQFVNVIAPQIVDIYFVLDSYTITTAAYGNGTITPGTTIIYDPAYTYTYDVTPAIGYHISSILVNGQPITVPDPTHYSATLTDIHQDYLIEAFFEINTYTIEAVSGTHGSINPNGTTTYNWGTTAVYNVIADLGYYISAVTVDGVTTNYTQANNMTTWSTTFANIQGNHTVNVAFAQYTYTITATAGANGTITPSGITTLPYGGSQLYTIAPATGYEIVAVTVDGVNMGVITQYTFADVTANHTIAVTFAPLQYTIDAIASVGGSITPSGTAVYNYGASVTYNATANTGYTISTVTVDGVVTNVNAATWSHAFNNITDDHAIYVAFEINTYTITVNQAANGAITPGTQTVNYGTTPSFYITPNVGYAVSSVLVDGSSVSFTTDLAGVATYTFPAIAANHSITATFAVKTLTIVASTNGNGTITPAGTTTLNYGASQTYNITPANGSQIIDVLVDNISIGAVNTYRFSNVTVNHTIAAHFALIACETPSYLYATNITENSATLNWSNTGADSYTVRFKTLDTADYTEIAGITSNYYVLNDLTDDTYYVWTVKAVCDYNESDWAVQSSFTTLETPIIGIHEAALSTVKVYSNLNNVYIVNNNQVAIKQVEIFDMFGRVIYVGTAANNPEVISLMVANGTYVVRLATTEGVATYKVNITR